MPQDVPMTGNGPSSAPSSFKGRVLSSQGILADVLPEEPVEGAQTIDFAEPGNVAGCFAEGTVRCRQPTDSEYALVGDWVEVEQPESVEGVENSPAIHAIEPRKSTIRKAMGREIQTVAANVDHLWLVVAPEPPLRPGLINRILVAAESEGIPATLLFNKLDLPNASEEWKSLGVFVQAGYEVLPVSAVENHGIDALRNRLGEGLHVLAGHSGVGKSTLINALLGEERARTGMISQVGKGRHTTTSAVAYRVGKGLLVDTPGVRSFALAEIAHEELRECFPEFVEAQPECKFGDCRHVDEAGCAVLKRVEEGLIHRDRYDSYRKLLAEITAETLERTPYRARRRV